MTGEPRWRRRWAIRLTAHAAKVMPESLSEWATALANELDSIAGDQAAFRWAVGAVTTSYQARIRIMQFVLTRTFLASCLGMVHIMIAASIWGYLAAGNNPIANWLVDSLGSRDVFWLAIGIHDVIVNILIALPFAAFLFIRASMNKWKYASVAGAAAAILVYWDTNWSPWLYTEPRFWLGFASVLFSLPIAFAAIRAIRRPAQPS